MVGITHYYWTYSIRDGGLNTVKYNSGDIMKEQETPQEVNNKPLTHEQIISESQRGVDRSLTILNYSIVAIGENTN